MINKFKVSAFRVHTSGFRLLLLLFTFNISLLTSFAQNNDSDYQIKSSSVTLYSGISVPIRGGRYWNHNWEPEYLVGGNVFVHLNKRILAGIRFNFNHWLIHPNAVTEGYPSGIDWTVTTGHANVIEVVPSFRIILSDEYNKSNLFLQFGGGYFNLQGNYSIAGTQYDNNGNPINNFSNANTFHYNNLGLNLGLGIKAGRVEIFPLYSIMFTPQEPTNFITLNVGYHF